MEVLYNILIEFGIPMNKVSLIKMWMKSIAEYRVRKGADKSLARPELKKLQGCHFSSDEKAVATAETLFDGQYFEFFWVAYRS